MNWAPVIRVASTSGQQWGSLNIVDESVVEWRRFGAMYRRYTMPCPVQDALFTRFAHARDPSETWVVIVCRDRLVHSYATKSGEHYVVGITFVPQTVLICPEQGVLFTSTSPSHPSQLLHLLQGPEELLGSVVPASVCAPLSISDRVLFFNEHYAVVWDSEKTQVRAYTVRFIHSRLSRPGSAQASVSAGSGVTSAGSATPSSLSTGSLSLESLNKVAVIQLVREWRQGAVGRIFSQQLDAPAAKMRMIVVHDPVEEALFAYCDGELIRHSDVAYACPIAGIRRFPGVVMAFKDTLQFAFLLFPQTPVLGIPLPKQCNGLSITGLESDPRANWMDVEVGSGKSYRLRLVASFDNLVGTCIGIVQDVLGPVETAFWLASLLAQRRHTNDYWEAFEETMDALSQEIDATQVSHLVSCLHLLREEYTLASGSEEVVRQLGHLIRRYIGAWGPNWVDYYGSSAMESSYDVPRTMESPPNIYSALIATMQSQNGQHHYPDITTHSLAFPKTRALLAFFRLLGVETPIEDMRHYLKQHLSGNKLVELAPAIQICVMEVAEYLDFQLDGDVESPRSLYDNAGMLGNRPPPRISENLESRVDNIAQALFPLDRRFHEAQRLLQTKEAQQCAFGAFYDPELISDHEIAHLQSQWGRALAERALASAFGRAAIELGSRNPVVWEQLEVPTIDFSGECTVTGLSIPPYFKSLEQVSAQAPWGLFAHGAALGLSVRPDSPGVNSLWVITSARLKSASAELYAGLVFGMGLSGHLAGLEEWQFYESLVSSNSRGTVAALLGVAASKRGSRDSKLTKVFSVHIRALLPEPARSEPLVGPEEERAAIISLGLLYQGKGVRHLTEVLSREILSTQRQEVLGSPGNRRMSNEADDMEQLDGSHSPSTDDEDYNLAVGLALGLINSGKANLGQLLPLVTRARDRTSFSPGIVNGALCALLLCYVGSNAHLVAAQIQLPSSQRAAIYSTPSAVFTKALVRHLIMWDQMVATNEWVLAQVPPAMRPGSGEVSEIEGLWYINALGGVLTALALRHTATNDEQVVGILLDFIESVFYPEYARLLGSLSEKDDVQEKRVSYDSVQAAKSVARLISALCLAVAATAAGSGNIRVLQVLRVAYQIGPQVQASERPRSALVEGLGIDPVGISEAIGWLFMGGGQWSFRSDPESVGLLACVSFLPLIGGPGIKAESWYHLKFLWVLVAERRCLHVASDPTEKAQVEIIFKSGEVRPAQIPTLLPPLSELQEVRVVDERYRPFTTSDIPSLASGLPLVRNSGPQDTLGAHLVKSKQMPTRSLGGGRDLRNVAKTALEVMHYAAKHKASVSHVEALRLLLAFGENWPATENSRIVKTKDCEQLKLSMWRRLTNTF